jgi:CheY-like chemotaxis protein
MDGWEVSEAIDGYETIAQVSKIKPDLVVLDFAMPRLNGLQTAAKISASFPNLPIILYTFYGFEAMNAEAKKHGIREVVDKTETGDFLLKTIAKYLSQTKTSLPTPSTDSVDSTDKDEPPQLNN